MEDGLVPNQISEMDSIASNVLILVVVEDGLVLMGKNNMKNLMSLS